MTTGQVLTVIGLVGFGGLLQIAFDFFVESKKSKTNCKTDTKRNPIQGNNNTLLCILILKRTD